MGGSFSLDYLLQLTRSEFERVLGNKQRDYLKISEILQLKLPEEISLSFYHIGTLFVIDENKDGRFYLKELENHAAFCHNKQKNYKAHEITCMLQAACTLILWQSVNTEEGEDDFVAWIGLLLYENENVAYFDTKPGVPFIRSDTIVYLFEILNVKTTHGLEFQIFFDLLQQAAEEVGLMSIENEDMDDYVPLTICQQFARDFIKGFSRLMRQIGFETGKH